jgi:hypothetical protein
MSKKERISKREAVEQVKNENNEVVEEKHIYIQQFTLIEDALYALTTDNYYVPWKSLKLISSE